MIGRLSTILLYTFFLRLSRAKGVFFINFGKKFFRVLGYIVCVLMLLTCIFLIVCSAAFSSKDTVGAFGANIYIVQADGYDKAPKGSVVLVQKTTAFELSEGKLVLYTVSADSTQCALGYVENIYVVDGQYYLTVTGGDSTVEISEQRLVGRADYSSVVLGAVLTFIKTPFGIFCVAVLPCIALILYDIIRAAALRLPDPEVEPLYKNSDETGNLDKAVANRRSISVNSDGNASYSKKKPENASSGDDVLFTYGKRKNPAAARPIIPLNDKKADDTAEANKPAPVEKPKLNPAAMDPSKPETPENVAVSRYKTMAESEGGKTGTDAPQIPRRESGDAFFAQTTTSSLSNGIPKPNNAPQIGRQISKRSKSETDSEQEAETPRPVKTAGKRSSQILASKRVEDLIDDDDDVRSKKRITNSMVDDIMSGIKNNSNDTK